MNTPVAFFIFNRPDLTERVFEAIARAKPSQLLIVADGPRHAAEELLCSQSRAVIEKVDWDCEVHTNFSDVNLGCKKRVSSGLDWVFSLVEEAIILEDDCEPAPGFFQFCEKMLERYRDDPRIMHVSGNNFVDPNLIEFSYYFSRYIHIWGWATWRRAWKQYDVSMSKWPQSRDNIFASGMNTIESNHWDTFFNSVYSGEIDTWDCQWHFACWLQSGLAIVPRENLISNIGFREDATHTRVPSPFANLPVGSWDDNVREPPYVMADFRADAIDRSKWVIPPRTLKRRIRNRLMRYFGKKS